MSMAKQAANGRCRRCLSLDLVLNSDQLVLDIVTLNTTVYAVKRVARFIVVVLAGVVPW
jgi:hypothetical protein